MRIQSPSVNRDPINRDPVNREFWLNENEGERIFM